VQAGVLLIVTGIVGSLWSAVCAISDQAVADWITASPEVVLAPVVVGLRSA
jgi:hypothetical protein